jgi:hypothetical protein
VCDWLLQVDIKVCDWLLQVDIKVCDRLLQVDIKVCDRLLQVDIKVCDRLLQIVTEQPECSGMSCTAISLLLSCQWIFSKITFDVIYERP